MNKQAVITIVVIFVLLVAGMFAFTFMQQQDLDQAIDTSTDENVDDTEENPYGISQIDATHYFIDGTHTLVGEVVMPTPCDLLETETMVRESMPEQVVVEFSVINTAETCAQVLTPQRFMVNVDVSEQASFEATFMDDPVTLNLIPAPEGETPEEFEVYIKG